jgi:hypothetical protein
VFSPEYLQIVSVKDRDSEKAENIRDVQEAIFVLVLFVDAAHQSRGGWQNLVDEDEDCLLGAELDSLANNIDELANGEVCGDEVLLLVDSSDVRLLDLFADDLGCILSAMLSCLETQKAET